MQAYAHRLLFDQQWRRARFGRQTAITIVAAICGVVGGIEPAGSVLAQDATPVSHVISSFTDCSITPRPDEDFFEIASDPATPASDTLATPVPPTGGVPADAVVTDAVLKTIEESFTCLYAGDVGRVAALVTDEQFRRAFSGVGLEAATALLSTPIPAPPGVRPGEVIVSNIRVYPDGGASAVVATEGRESLTLFAKVGDRYLIDYSYVAVPMGTPTP